MGGVEPHVTICPGRGSDGHAHDERVRNEFGGHSPVAAVRLTGAVALQAFYADTATFLGVIAGWRGTVGTGAMLMDALRHVTPRGDTAVMFPGATPYEAAQVWFRRLDRARTAGDWAAFGEAWDGLRRVLGLSPGGPRVAPPPPRD